MMLFDYTLEDDFFHKQDNNITKKNKKTLRQLLWYFTSPRVECNINSTVAKVTLSDKCFHKSVFQLASLPV